MVGRPGPAVGGLDRQWQAWIWISDRPGSSPQWLVVALLPPAPALFQPLHHSRRSRLGCLPVLGHAATRGDARHVPVTRHGPHAPAQHANKARHAIGMKLITTPVSSSPTPTRKPST